MRLEDIGFYTLSDDRAANASDTSPMWRCEMILTDQCNFNCPYCRRSGSEMDVEVARHTISLWLKDGLKNIRFSGGEPTMYPYLNELVRMCSGIDNIAISTNGSQEWSVYEELISDGVTDFSVSLDACCADGGDKMAGAKGHWDTVTSNIRKMAAKVYVTVGVVITDENASDVGDIVEFASSLGVADIRIISAAQHNRIVEGVADIGTAILDRHPILKYRVNHFLSGRSVRGIKEADCRKCHLVKDDSIVSGDCHYPCVIYMREGGSPIGKVGPGMRSERLEWASRHVPANDPICSVNCLDVCVDYNNQAMLSKGE